MTDAMRRAADWLKERGCTGVVDRHGRVLAAGEVASHIATETWLRLCADGAVRGEGGRLNLIGEYRTW